MSETESGSEIVCCQCGAVNKFSQEYEGTEVGGEIEYCECGHGLCKKCRQFG